MPGSGPCESLPALLPSYDFQGECLRIDVTTVADWDSVALQIAQREKQL